MKFKDWLNKWNLSYLKINAEFLEVELKFSDTDKNAAWEMYVELLTRVATQPIDIKHGDEEAALQSIYSLFDSTRSILKKYGTSCVQFTKIAVVILNQVIRPFTTKWHPISLSDGFKNDEVCNEFRQELTEVQQKIISYTQSLSEIAGVEDLTYLER